MHLHVESRIHKLSALCGAMAVFSLIVPRFVGNPEGGFAAGAGAVLTLLAMLLATLIVSGYLAVVTLRHFAKLHAVTRLAGLLPAIVLAVGLAWLLFFLRY